MNDTPLEIAYRKNNIFKTKYNREECIVCSEKYSHIIRGKNNYEICANQRCKALRNFNGIDITKPCPKCKYNFRLLENAEYKITKCWVCDYMFASNFNYIRYLLCGLC
jgi:hypothetical protein